LRLGIDHLGARSVHRHRGAHEVERLGGLRALLQRHHGLQLRVHVDLLLDPANETSCWGELVGIERIERILVLELRGEQLEKGVEVACDRVRATLVVAGAPVEIGDCGTGVAVTLGRVAGRMSVDMGSPHTRM